MRARLEYTEGYWWKRISDGMFLRCAYLADWDNISNYTLVTDVEHDEQTEEITDTEALEIITGIDNE